MLGQHCPELILDFSTLPYEIGSRYTAETHLGSTKIQELTKYGEQPKR